ncbi:hypothetical protein KAH94_06100 [bacterium]|nr:hypothetical protein [bacterium]
MVGPWISFIPTGVVIGLSDLQFIQDRVDAGEWLEAHGAIDAATNEIAIVPASGKTLYMYKAKIVTTGLVAAASDRGSGTDTTSNNMVEAAFKVNGTVKDSTNIGMSTKASSKTNGTTGGVGGSGYGSIGDGKFDVAGLSLVGDGIKDVTIENIVDNGSADATMSAWIKTT